MQEPSDDKWDSTNQRLRQMRFGILRSSKQSAKYLSKNSRPQKFNRAQFWS